MSAAEFIHPDWARGFHRMRGWFKRGDEPYLLDEGDVLIFKGDALWAPFDNWLYDRHGNPWVVTRRMNYEQKGILGGWNRRARVYARRDPDRKPLPS